MYIAWHYLLSPFHHDGIYICHICLHICSHKIISFAYVIGYDERNTSPTMICHWRKHSELHEMSTDDTLMLQHTEMGNCTYSENIFGQKFEKREESKV